MEANLKYPQDKGTDYDMTKGVDTGPFSTPNRWRPIAMIKK